MSKKKKSNSLLPKRIAGVKVPKAVRKGRFGQLLASKTGQALIAEAIMAAGAFGAAKKASDDPKTRSFVHDAAESVRSAGDTDKVDAGSAREVLAYALGEAARSFADALRRGPEGHAKPESRSFAAAHEPPDYVTAPLEAADAKKKQSPYEAGPI